MSLPDIKFITDLDQFYRIIRTGANHKVIMFTAAWCGPCKIVRKNYSKLANDFINAEFYKVDVDQMEELTKKYNIVNVPSYCVFKVGQLEQTYYGAQLNRVAMHLRRRQSRAKSLSISDSDDICQWISPNSLISETQQGSSSQSKPVNPNVLS